MGGHTLTHDQDGTVRCSCGMAWHPEQCKGATAAARKRAHQSRISRHLQAADARRRQAARMGAIDPPISEWSEEEYASFAATGQLD